MCMVVPCLHIGGIHVYPFCVPWFNVYGEDWTGICHDIQFIYCVFLLLLLFF